MKAVAGLLLLVASALAISDDACPPEQVIDWTIEKLLPHEECGKFYQCTHGRPVEMPCPAGLHFNVAESICDWPALANCQGNTEIEPQPIQGAAEFLPLVAEGEGVTDDLPEETIATDKPEIEFQENGCPVDPHIHWLLPDAQNCSVFYSCVWGSKVERPCPPNLHFNREKQVCDWPATAGCVVNAQ
ncbi:unnamed protein product [Leptosia nina]|uniref:Chitin-binding type-2 domain-containing protein n=1 Tax=Leptosia nina TaxID=320188 RepID=A0AAV1JVA5_9NEOP